MPRILIPLRPILGVLHLLKRSSILSYLSLFLNHQVLQNDSNVTSVVSSVEQGGGTVEQHPENVEETRILATKVEKVNSVNRKLRETNANLTTQLSKEGSTVSSLQEEKKRLKSDFKICEDELLDKQI
ncbi:hypothetical protein Tco_0028399 [Tanacetum coccineum]